MAERDKGEGILSPYRVLDLADEKGLLCGKILGDLGADIIKIEKPGGDTARRQGPFFEGDPDLEKSLFWFAYNTSKKGITLDIEKLDGRKIFKRLVENADFVIETFSPGYLDSLGLGYSDLEKINPRLILVSITPFGQTGPYKNWKTSDIVAWAMGGEMAPCGDRDRPPYRVSYHSQAYLNAGVDAAQGALTALFYLWSTGEGQQVDVSIQESVVQATEHITAAWDRRKTIQQRGAASGIRSSQLWPCSDGFVCFAHSGGRGGVQAAKSLIEWMGNDGKETAALKEFDWSKFEPRAGQKVPEEAVALTADFFLSHTKMELLEGALKYDVQLYPVSNPIDLLENPQLKARDFWQELEHPELGATLCYPGSFVRTSEAPPRISRRAPLIGEHNEEVYMHELGISKEKMLILKQAGVI